jgi:hypothetical protein
MSLNFARPAMTTQLSLCAIPWSRSIAAVWLFFALSGVGFAADDGSQLAGKMRAKESGSSFVRIRMQTGTGDNQTLQVQIKSRISQSPSDVVYQILFPKERKGESVLLHRSGNKIDGTLFTLPNTLKPISSSDMKQSIFGTALS